MKAIPIVGVGALSSMGAGIRGLGLALENGVSLARPSQELSGSHPGVKAFELASLPEPSSLPEKRARMLMSRAAVLASAATAAVLSDAGWEEPRDDVGFYLGVGASGGSTDQLTAMLRACVDHGELSLARFGVEGLRACNPLFAFQLMNNFTLCHSAILNGTSGPNAAFFSRGAGTVIALQEAAHAIDEGESTRVLAGGADSCLHPVTWSELIREGYVDDGLVPGEGAAIVALGAGKPIAYLEQCAVITGRAAGIACALSTVRIDADVVDVVVVAPWGSSARDALCTFAAGALPTARVLDSSTIFGESLAASPALAWAAAIDLLVAQGLRRALVLSAGLDGDVGVVMLRGGSS